MNERSTILGRIKEALCFPSPRPGDDHSLGADHPALASSSHANDWLPQVGPTYEEWKSLFAKNAQELKAEFIPCRNPEHAGAELAALALAGNWTRLALHSDSLLHHLAKDLSTPQMLLQKNYAPLELEACSAGLTICDALIAQTGGILLTSRSTGGRALSVLPPHHIVVATREQLLPDLPTAFALLKAKYDGNYPSMMTFITGPSRTGDIERILVLGAHGPKRVTILLID